MSRKLLTVWVLAAAALLPAIAQETEEKKPDAAPSSETAATPNAWGVYLGYMRGGQIGKQNFPGFGTAQLDDATEIGALWSQETSPRLRFETRGQLGFSKVKDVPNGGGNTIVVSLDFALIPHWQLGKTWLGVPLGLGWGINRNTDVYANRIPRRDPDLQLKSGNGMTYFFGVQANWSWGKSWIVFADVRARRYHRLLNVTEKNLQAIDLSFGMMRRF